MRYTERSRSVWWYIGFWLTSPVLWACLFLFGTVLALLAGE